MPAVDSCFLDSLTVTSFFGSQRMRDRFSDRRIMQSWLDVESALARAQAGCGLIPQLAAEAITAAAQVDQLDLAAVAGGVRETVHPLEPTVRALAAACPGDAGRYVHMGATTQDVMDTGLVLCARQGLDVVRALLDALTRHVRRLAIVHRESVMAARTHGQQALPTTFGLRCAVWAGELQRHQTRLDEMLPRLSVVSFGGAAGTMAGYGSLAFELERAVAGQLGLGVADTPWHAAQDRFAECVTVLGLLASTAEKIAREVYFLGRTEIAEVREAQDDQQVGSSAMPHKANPIRCEAVISAAMTVRSQVPLALGAMVAQDDRDMGSGMAFWKLMPECFILTGGLLERLAGVLENLHVDTGRMRQNLEATGGLVLSEAVMLRLAEVMGRGPAHHAVTELVHRAEEEGRSFFSTLEDDPTVRRALGDDGLAALRDPATYLGQATALVDRLLLGSSPA